MRLLRKLEFASGLATLLFGAVQVAVTSGTNSYAARPSENLRDFLWVATASVVMPALVALGSYFHGIKQKRWGLYLLGVCGLFACGLIFMTFFVFVFSWFHPIWLAFVSLAPSLMAALTLVLALLVATDL